MFGFSTGLVLGKSGSWSVFPKVYLPEAQRVGHVYVVGKTGKGKSTFLQHGLFQDITQGRGCGVIDPHGDLIADLLWRLHHRHQLTPELRARIIYLNPAEHRYVLPFNVLASPGDPYEIAQNVIEAFRRTWPQALAEAPHFSNLMLHSLLVLIKSGRTLTELPTLLTDKPFREAVLRQIGESELSAFFHDRFDAWGRWGQGAVMKESSLNKVTALTLNPHLRRMLGQKENRLNFRSIMDNGQVLLVDLGACDEESRLLIGSLITTGIEQAVMTRQNVATAKRRPFYLYVDEFQDFSSHEGSVKTLAKILVSARKFGLYLTIAHQYLGQLSLPMQAAVMGNAWTKVVFGVSEADATVLAPWIGLGSIDPAKVKHEAQTEVQHPLYTSIPEQWQAWATNLANQPPRQALVRDHLGKVKRIWTVALNDPPRDEQVVEAIKLKLLKRSGVTRSERSGETVASQGDEGQKMEDWPEYERS